MTESLPRAGRSGGATAAGSRPTVLLVDDDPSIRFGTGDYLEANGFEVASAGSLREAEQAFAQQQPDVAVVDYQLPDGTALDLLPRLFAAAPECSVLVLTGYGTIELAVHAMRAGAENFLTKPVELATLKVVLQRAVESRRARRVTAAGRSREQRHAVDPFIGQSRAIRELEAEATHTLGSDRPVLILGPTGSGKGVLANWIHRNGPRGNEPFVDINCAGLPRELLDSELFGHEKGAFTGAHASKAGLLEVASRGTLFLDEIGDMDLGVQSKLLKVLEDRRFRRLGGLREIQVDVRLVAATHQDLLRAVSEKRFRDDLFYRVSVLPIRVPALRERREDLAELAASLLRALAIEMGRATLELSADALAALMSHDWPGNVRELRNVLERAVLRTRDGAIGRADVQFFSTRLPDGNDRLEEIERRHIERILGEEGGRVEAAARRLGMPRSTLYQRLKDLGLR